MAEVFPVIPEELPAQTADSIGRSPAFVFRADGRSAHPNQTQKAPNP